MMAIYDTVRPALPAMPNDGLDWRHPDYLHLSVCGLTCWSHGRQRATVRVGPQRPSDNGHRPPVSAAVAVPILRAVLWAAVAGLVYLLYGEYERNLKTPGISAIQESSVSANTLVKLVGLYVLARALDFVIVGLRDVGRSASGQP